MDKLDLDPAEKPKTHVITFAVLKGGESAVLIDYPDEMEDSLDGADLDDNCIEGWPKVVGCYTATATFWFSQGYCDGYPADGESEWGYKLTEVRRLQSLPQGEAPEYHCIGCGDPTDLIQPVCEQCERRPGVAYKSEAQGPARSQEAGTGAPGVRECWVKFVDGAPWAVNIRPYHYMENCEWVHMVEADKQAPKGQKEGEA